MPHTLIRSRDSPGAHIPCSIAHIDRMWLAVSPLSRSRSDLVDQTAFQGPRGGWVHKVVFTALCGHRTTNQVHMAVCFAQQKRTSDWGMQLWMHAVFSRGLCKLDTA